MSASDLFGKIFKIAIILLGARFLYEFFRDSYDELFFNPVHFFEDAYMFIRYAKIWHLGYGESWNIGEGPVYGNTSQLHFLFVLLLTSFPALSDDAIIKISSYVPAFIFIAWLPWFCARHSTLFAAHPNWQKYLLWLGIICPPIYWHSAFAYHYLTGMDTSLSILLHLLLIDTVLTYGKVSDGKPGHAKDNEGFLNKSHLLILVIALSYLGFLTRPENILAATLFSALYFLLILKDRHALKLYVLSMAAIIVVDSLVKYFYFGDFLPLAFYSKQAGFIKGNIGAGFSHPAYYFFYFLATILPFVAIQLFALRKDNALKQAILVIPALVTIAYFFTMMTVMNMKGRYFYPFTPYFIAAAVIAFGPRTFQPRAYLKNIAALILYLIAYVGITVADQKSADIVHALAGEQDLCEDNLKTPLQNYAGVGYRVDTGGFDHVVHVLKDAPADFKVVMTEHGYVGSKLPTVHIIDITGLHNPYVAKHGFSAEWLFKQAPDMIWMPHWHNTCMTHDILYNDEFWAHYRFYPGIFTWGVALRKDGPYYQKLNKAVDDQVQEIYPGYPLSSFEKTRN